MKDKATSTTLARDCIVSVLIINIRQTPSWKTAVVYKRASNTDAAIGMTEDASLEILSRQFAKAMNLFKITREYLLVVCPLLDLSSFCEIPFILKRGYSA